MAASSTFRRPVTAIRDRQFPQKPIVGLRAERELNEYGAEIGRAIVNFDGPIVFCVLRDPPYPRTVEERDLTTSAG